MEKGEEKINELAISKATIIIDIDFFSFQSGQLKDPMVIAVANNQEIEQLRIELTPDAYIKSRIDTKYSPFGFQVHQFLNGVFSRGKFQKLELVRMPWEGHPRFVNWQQKHMQYLGLSDAKEITIEESDLNKVDLMIMLETRRRETKPTIWRFRNLQYPPHGLTLREKSLKKEFKKTALEKNTDENLTILME